jgi:glycosyltransferase involved in cell wall biosynthesis
VRALLVLPTYNEAATLDELVRRALTASPELDVLVVDDASPDGTGEIADALARETPRVRVLHRPAKAGLGRAYVAGFRLALEGGYEVACEMDADLSHDPADLPRLLAALAGADVAVGSRYVPGGGTRGWSRGRLVLSRAGTLYARMLLGLPLTDATSGFRCYRRAVLEAIPLEEVRSEGYAFQVEMAWRAWALGFRIVEVPIVFTERRAGRSKMSRRIVVEALWRVAAWGLARRRPPAHPHPRSVAAGSRPLHDEGPPRRAQWS